VAVAIIHIEIGFNAQYAPARALVQVYDEGVPEENAECFADIISDEINVEKQPLRTLESVYEVIDSASFFTPTDLGFYLLETGFTDFEGDFEIRIVCYTPEFRGVSYTIIDGSDKNDCSIQDDGRVVIC